MLYIIIGIIVIFSIFVLLYLFTGKPKKVELKEEGFLDSYQYVDFQNGGRVTLPYAVWNDNLRILIKGDVNFVKTTFIGNRYKSLPLKVEIFPDKNNPTEEIELSFREKEDINVYTESNPMKLFLDGSKKPFELIIFVKLINPHFTVLEPTQIGFTLEASYSIRNTNLSKRLIYSFFVGKELGESWIALDPGTTGSCIVAATETNNITIQKDIDGEVITPSVISFNSTKAPSNIDIENHNYYQFGNPSVAELALNTVTAFQSFKKLLGFTDKTVINFSNKQTIEIDGQILSSLLIRGLIKELKSYIESNSDDYKFLLNENGVFVPTRAVIAIPNNFTAPKIMDIVNALGTLKQFDEIRYISESEAVLCYYIYHHSKFNKDESGLKDETVLIFDMGGATINATIADAYFDNKDKHYKIDIDSKIGYNVGGDTVDYCLAKYFLGFSSDYPDLEKINPFRKDLDKEEIIRRKQKIIPILFDLKKKIIRNYENRSKITVSRSSERRILLYPAEIQNAFKELGVEMILSNASNIFTNLMENEYGSFPIFDSPYFKEYIFDAIKDAVNDVVELSRAKGGHIDTIIFSGRTTLFPMIKETVTEQIKSIKSIKKDTIGEPIAPVWVAFDDIELKTAVAKGACIYGINRNLIDVSQSKTNNTIGFLKRESLQKNHFEFKELIKGAQQFKEERENIYFIKGENLEKHDFKADNSKINFIQVVGVNPDKIIREEQKHKYSELAQIKISNPTKKISAILKNDDSIMFEVELNTGHIEKRFATLKSQEVSEANEEHYTWMAKS
jgi:hypothetical protein